jgi:hypothetical protein
MTVKVMLGWLAPSGGVPRKVRLLVLCLELGRELPDVVKRGPQCYKPAGMLNADPEPIGDARPQPQRYVMIPQVLSGSPGVQQMANRRITAVIPKPSRLPPQSQVNVLGNTIVP